MNLTKQKYITYGADSEIVWLVPPDMCRDQNTITFLQPWWRLDEIRIVVEDPINMRVPYSASLIGTTSADIKVEGPKFNYQLLDYLMDQDFIIRQFPKEPTYKGDALNDFSSFQTTNNDGTGGA